ncbi:hypothetical protein OC846_003327 [Tilletia horrida]|uniref:Uncharacterized protein n=1 Tax=Tilletia horrida TaxID=155126 RepID=A0AAN6GSE5_9BASI|nr:hypothetical protein OC846_003327 [Tilletia horrida]KAK0568628.1 hypothetical protein OC861_001790 [Tilletia horrida]
MYCLRWWIPLFLLPFPTAPPSFLILFIIAYVFHTRPCAYCGVIIIGLFISSCYWYLDLVPADALLSPDEINHDGGSMSSPATGLGGANQTEPVRGGGGTLPQQVMLVAAAAALKAGNAAKVYLAPWVGSDRPPQEGASDTEAERSRRQSGAEADQLQETTSAAGSLHSSGPNKLSNLLRWKSAKSKASPDSASTSTGGRSDSIHAQRQDQQELLSPEEQTTQFKPGRTSNRDLLARCPGAGRCWFDFALMASHGLFEPSPCYRLPESGCKPTVGDSSTPSSGASSQSSSSSSSNDGRRWPTFRELLTETTRQRQVQRAIQADIQRKIEEEQAEVIQAVVAEEADAAEAAAREARQHQDATMPSSSSAPAPPALDKTETGTPTSAAAAARSKAERQSRARRIKSRSRKPAFRKADPEVDGEHTRGTYWIGVPGTAVGAFFDFSLR